MEIQNYEMTEQASLGGSLGGSVATKFLNEVHGARSLSQAPNDATASPTHAKLPEMVIGTTTGNPTEGTKSGIGDNVNGKASNKLDLTKCDTKFRNPSEVDSRTAGKKVNDVRSASPDGSSEGSARDGSNAPVDDKNTPTKNEQNREEPSQKNGTDLNGPGEGFDPSQKKFETDKSDEDAVLEKSAEKEDVEQRNDDPLIDETDESAEDAVLEKSAEEEEEEKRNDDPLIDESEDEDDEVDASDNDPYVKLEAGPGSKDGPQTDDEEVPTQILVMKNGRPVPRSHGSDAGREKEGLPNPAYEQTLLIESLWR